MSEKAFPVKIGLEVHGYLDTCEKLFCMCRTDSLDSETNSNICPICTGTPGSKPMAVNEEAVRKMLQIATVFKSKINMDKLVWQRKHYDWADNPKGYQTTLSGAHAKVNAVGGKFKGINITELHLEEDPAQWNPNTGRINYNRSGLPLIEIVTEPEFSDSEQVVEWLKSLLLSLSYIKAVRKNAGIKVDVNVSTYGERVEMKNLNSLEKIRKAIDYEIVRQVENHGRGIEQKRDTLAYDESKGITIKMRSKEGASDYRFIPCPDLAELKIDSKMLNEVRASMPEMPEVKLERLLRKYNVGESDAKILTRNLELVDFFEGLVESKTVSGNVVLVHGSNEKDREKLEKGFPEQNKRNWIPWVKKELEKKGVVVNNPLMPENWNPDYKKWKMEIEKINIDENSVLVGTSAGGAFLVHWLQGSKVKIKKLILLAPAYRNKLNEKWQENNLYDFEVSEKLKDKASEIILIEYSNDSDSIKESCKIYSKILGLKPLVLKNRGHFCQKSVDEIMKLPELVDEILGKSEDINIKSMIPWVTVELLRVLNYNKKSLEDEDVDIRPEHLAELIRAVEEGKITVLKGKQIMNDFVPKSFSLADHKEEIGNISEEAVKNLCRQVIDENVKVVEDYKNGKKASLNFLIGQVMRLSERRADFRVITEVMKRLIK